MYTARAISGIAWRGSMRILSILLGYLSLTTLILNSIPGLLWNFFLTRFAIKFIYFLVCLMIIPDFLYKIYSDYMIEIDSNILIKEYNELYSIKKNSYEQLVAEGRRYEHMRVSFDGEGVYAQNALCKVRYRKDLFTKNYKWESFNHSSRPEDCSKFGPGVTIADWEDFKRVYYNKTAFRVMYDNNRYTLIAPKRWCTNSRFLQYDITAYLVHTPGYFDINALLYPRFGHPWIGTGSRRRIVRQIDEDWFIVIQAWGNETFMDLVFPKQGDVGGEDPSARYCKH